MTFHHLIISVLLEKWIHWCFERNSNNLIEVNVVYYLAHLVKQKCFYSVVDLDKAMPKQNLFPFRVDWNNNQIFIQNLLWFFFFYN